MLCLLGSHGMQHEVQKSEKTSSLSWQGGDEQTEAGANHAQVSHIHHIHIGVQRPFAPKAESTHASTAGHGAGYSSTPTAGTAAGL